uniref:Uncharacterized protein n=1 Tax=Anguilla anguilla TaxID=7936 RepID=A0A0E9U725_ANGAN
MTSLCTNPLVTLF